MFLLSSVSDCKSNRELCTWLDLSRCSELYQFFLQVGCRWIRWEKRHYTDGYNIHSQGTPWCLFGHGCLELPSSINIAACNWCHCLWELRSYKTQWGGIVYCACHGKTHHKVCTIQDFLDFKASRYCEGYSFWGISTRNVKGSDQNWSYWDSQQGRVRTTSILVQAFWTFKLNT